ncbi:glycosyltransferase [Pyrobaculum sp.]|uniref:glycosyltransferase n=1 Tax=Pyrobaculum sp. TaxID=2004705 RepID=UPI00316B8080
MVKIIYIAKNKPHIGHWSWIQILRGLFKDKFQLMNLNRLKLISNSIIVAEGTKATLYGALIKPLNNCLAGVALSPSVLQPRVNKLYSTADVGVAVSSMVFDLLPSKRKTIIYPRPPELEHLLNINVDNIKKPWICYLGPLISIKGIHLIPEIARHVVKDVKNAKFIIIGDGMRDVVISKAIKYGLNDSLTTTGYIPRIEVFNLLRKCSVYIQPSLFDAFSVAVIEAMALGVVPVITKYVGSKDIVAKVDKGLVQEYNAERIANKIVEVLNSRSLKELMALSRYVVGEELSMEITKRRVISAIELCLK